MCLPTLPISVNDIKVERLLLRLMWSDARDFEEFKPFVDFVMESEWYKGLHNYCEKKNKDINQILDKHFLINPLELGLVSAIVPMHINRIDVAYDTEIYVIWKKCVANYINKRI